jgi:hypothetical protein
MDQSDKLTMGCLLAVFFSIPIIRWTYRAAQGAASPMTRLTLLPLVIFAYLFMIYALITSKTR